MGTQKSKSQGSKVTYAPNNLQQIMLFISCSRVKHLDPAYIKYGILMSRPLTDCRFVCT